MRVVKSGEIEAAVERLFIEANYSLPVSLENRIKECEADEQNELACGILKKLSENLDAARNIGVPICQDTGMAVLFAEIGNEVYVEGLPFEEAVNKGVANAYINGYLRKSVVEDPLFNRKNTGDNTPAIIHTRIVPGDKIRLTAAPKGFGSENMSAVKMFTPSASHEDIISFVVETVKNAGGNPCPPIVVGVGIGGNFEYCTYLAKKALARDVDERNSNTNYAELEIKMLERICLI